MEEKIGSTPFKKNKIYHVDGEDFEITEFNKKSNPISVTVYFSERGETIYNCPINVRNDNGIIVYTLEAGRISITLNGNSGSSYRKSRKMARKNRKSRNARRNRRNYSRRI